MYVRTYYSQCLEFEVDWEELGIDYDDVEEMYLKYATLPSVLKTVEKLKLTTTMSMR